MSLKLNGEKTMNNEITAKKDMYKAVGYTALLVASAFPLSLIGMQMLNFVLGNIKI
jgi:hypothetical protein